MGRKGPGAKTKIVLKSVSKMQQLGSMQNLKFQTFLNKNPPNIMFRIYLSDTWFAIPKVYSASCATVTTCPVLPPLVYCRPSQLLTCVLSSCRPSHRLFSPSQQQPLSKAPPQVGTINNQVKESAGLIKRKEVRKEPPHSESVRGN